MVVSNGERTDRFSASQFQPPSSSGEQARAQPFVLHAGALGVHAVLRRVQQVARRLPADRRVAGDQPADDDVIIEGGFGSHAVDSTGHCGRRASA